MNRIYKTIWSKIKERWILVSEKVAGAGGPAALVGAITMALFLSLSGTASALDPGALPTGGKITAGSGSIATSGNQMTVNQATQKMIANWSTFNIGKRAGVTFRQPDADSTALNRINDQNASQILGTLSANGKIYLINPSGIVFGKGAQVNVGGLVASSLNMLDSDFLAGKNKFYNAGYADDAGKIINEGDIKTTPGGIVALIAPKVINEGTITAESGSVVLAAGNQVSLDFKGDGLISYTIDQGAVDALAQNKGLVKADGGLVVMTAKAADTLTSAVVNNSGVIEAQTLQGKSGRILLLSDMENGQTIVSGKLDASAPNGGNGGFIETSGYDVKLNDSAFVTTNAPQGLTGTWLIDPTDFIVGTDISGSALSTNLNNGNVIIQTALAGAGNGDIFVNENVSWSTDNTLTMEAFRHINVNAGITATGNAAGLTITPDTGGGGGNYYLNNGAVITLSGLAPNLTIAGNDYTVINNANGGVVALQNMNNNLSGYYALGSNINAKATSTWNSRAGFVPVGNDITPFTGQFDGLGHTITKLTINRPTEDSIGLFGSSNGSIMNVGLVKGSIVGSDNVGALVGHNVGTVNNAYSTAPVSGGTIVGGLVGLNDGGQVTNSYTTGAVTGLSGIGSDFAIAMDIDDDGDNDVTGSINSGSIVGGLVGLNKGGVIDGTAASGNVSGGSILGGLVGFNDDGQVTNSAATGKVTGISGVGNIAFAVDMDIDMDLNLDGSSDVTGNISGTGSINGGTIVGGLVGLNEDGTIDGANASGNINGGSILGGLVGLNYGGQVTNSSAIGSVTGKSGVGDIAFSFDANIVSSIASPLDINSDGIIDGTGSINGTSSVSGTGSINGGNIVGGLVGFNAGGSIDNSDASGAVSGGSILGGLVGLNLDIPFDEVTGGQITNSSATGTITGKKDVGKIIFSGDVDIDGVAEYSMDMNFDGSIDSTGSIDGTSSISGTGSINGGSILGGLVGLNVAGSIDNSDASGTVSGGSILGGLVGLNLDIPFDEVTGGQIMNSSATGTITGKRGIGYIAFSGNVDINGVAEYSMDMNFDGSIDSTGSIDGASSISGTGSINGGSILGGLVGLNVAGNIDNSDASGAVSGGSILGGLVGLNLDIPYDGITGGGVTDSSATGSVTGIGKRGVGEIAFSGNMNMDGVAEYSMNLMDMIFDGSIDGTGSIFGTVSIKGGNIVGGLVGLNAAGIIDNSDASGAVNGGSILGGLVGLNADGQITNSYAIGSVTGKSGVGDIAFSVNADLDGAADYSMNLMDMIFDGSIDGTGSISGTGSIKGGNMLGGLVGLNAGGSIDGTTASGNVSGGSILGGLVGLNADGQITNSNAEGNVTGTSGAGDIAFAVNTDINGAVAYSMDTIFDISIDGTSSISGTGSIKGGNMVGGLVGLNAGGSIDGTTASGNVSGGSILGGLVGLNADGQITNSNAEGSVTGTSGVGDIAFAVDADINGAVAYSMDTDFDGIADLTNSIDLTGLYGLAKFHVTGSIKGGNIVGGLVGLNAGGIIDGTNASGNVSGGSILGSLVGLNYGGQITNSLATGSVSVNNYADIITFKDYITVFGFVIYKNVIYINGGDYIGGLVGLEYAP